MSSTRGTFGLALALIALGIALAGCRPAQDAHAAHQAGLGLDEPTDMSLYNVESRWLDRTGAERTLRSLAGRVQVVAMVYTNCAFACPRLLLDMKRIDGELGPDNRDRLGFVLVSIDPARDTPARLAEFAAGARLDDRWTLLTPAGGDDGSLIELAALLGVQYRQTSAGEFTHSNVLTVLDEHGEIIHRQEGLGADPTATIAAIHDAIRADATAPAAHAH